MDTGRSTYRPSGPGGEQEAKTMIRTHYDPEADAFAVHFAPKGAYVESQEGAPVLDASRRMTATATAPDAKRPVAE
jgi:hypothetical protein